MKKTLAALVAALTIISAVPAEACAEYRDIPGTPVRVMVETDYPLPLWQENMIRAEFNRIPAAVLDSFRGGVVVIGDDMAEYYGRVYGMAVGGLYHSPTGWIHVTQPGHLAHEMGHHIDHRLGWPGQHKRIWRAEREALSKLTGPYCLRNAREGYAEAFELYLSRPDDLREACPQYFACISKEIRQLERK